MAKKLLYALFKILHIALLTVVFVTGSTAYAQTSLSSGDVVIVTINTGSESGIDIIPLVDLEQGTELVLSNADWKERSKSIDNDGFTYVYTADAFISKGTAIRLTDSFELDEEFDQVIAYQVSSDGIYTPLFGAFWNTNPQSLLNPQRLFGRGRSQTIPEELKDIDAFIRFTTKGNHQYFIRNGASGSRNMLLEFTTNIAYWRQHDSSPFPLFGTSFTLLTPPVIQFDESRISVNERDKKVMLNIAIYEHDGSPLTLAAIFDPASSTLSKDEIAEESSYWLNFEGKVGNHTIEFEFPFKDDEVYEETELGFFYLDSLSSGSFGDFRTFSAFIRDDDIPFVEIVDVVSFPKPGILGDTNRDGVRDLSNDQYIIIQNKESLPVDFSDWRITTPRTRHAFDWETVLQPNQTITIFGGGKPDSVLFANQLVHTASSGGLALSENGGRIRLINEKGKAVTEYRYAAIKEEVLISDPLIVSGSTSSPVGNVTGASALPAITSQVVSDNGFIDINFPSEQGWNYVGAQILQYFPDVQLRTFTWNEQEGTFTESTNEAVNTSQSYLAFIDEANKEEDGIKPLSIEDIENPERIDFLLSATDRNEDRLITGSEGLNQFFNPLSSPIYARNLTNQFRDKLLGDDIGIQLFTVNQSQNGHVSYVPLNEQSLIAPFAPFWVKINAPLASTTVSLDVCSLQDPDLYEIDSEDDYEIEGSVKLGFSVNGIQKPFYIDFVDTEVLSHEIELSGIPELNLYEERTSWYGKKDNSPISRVLIPGDFREPVEIPMFVNVENDCVCDLGVETWDNIPFGVRLKIRDIETGEEYELEDDWQERFDVNRNNINEVINKDTPEFSESAHMRFVLRILPDGYIDPEEGDEIPADFELYQNFPNPFNPTTTIRFFLPEVSDVKLTIYNIVGQPIVVLAEGSFSQGEHERVWDASSYPSSIYISELVVGNKVLTRKMTLVK